MNERKSIPLNSEVCGNCKLLIDGKCGIDNKVEIPTRYACSHIDFEDKGVRHEELTEGC